MQFHQSHHTSRGGFTLIELLVSVSLFVVVMMVSIGTLLSLVDANRKSQSLKAVTNNVNFALDTMSRTLRTGSDIECGGGSPDCDEGDTDITFIDDKGCRITYAFVAPNGATPGYLTRRIANVPPRVVNCRVTAGAQRLTSAEADITDMKFYVIGATPGDNVQPMVTMVIKGQAGHDLNTDTLFNIQTTVTQRLLDI